MDSEPMCRACLSESGDAVPIFSSAETSGVQMPLSDMMMACSSVQVLSGDGLPGLICLECLRSLLIAFEFKLKCEKTDAMLREYIENNLVPTMQVGTIYNKSMTVDSGTLVPVSGNPSGDIKQIVGTNELISAIPTIAINNTNTIYGNTNPYIIPMVECDVLVKEEQDGMDGKMFQKCIASTAETNIMLKKMTVDSQSNLTPVNTTVDMTTFSPRLISSEMIQPSPSQITIYSPEFRDLIRVSEEQATTLVMPKIDGIPTVNSMAQCSVLTTNSYAIDQSQCSAIIQNNIISGNGQQTTNNNFLNAMTIPSNMAFAIKENNVRKRPGQICGKTTSMCIKTENDQIQETTSMDTQTYQIKNEVEDECLAPDQSPGKKQKTFHHKKKTVYNVNVAESCSRPRLKVKDCKGIQTGTKRHDQNDINDLHSDSETENATANLKNVKDTIYYHPNQGFIR